jgi:flagellar motor switch protein FliN/FliY
MSTVENIEVEISVVLGSTSMPVHQLLRMGRGAVIETSTHESDDVLVLANDTPIAKAQVIVKGEKIGISITEVLTKAATQRIFR